MNSPYLKPFRLADVARAIQVMGTYRYHSRLVEDWSKNLDEPHSAPKWKEVFQEHPEFFRIKIDKNNNVWAFLVWRRAYEKTYYPDLGRDLTSQEIADLSPEQKEDLGHRPLTSDQIEALPNTAVSMHEREVARQQARRWWIPVAPAVFGFLGALAGAILKMHR